MSLQQGFHFLQVNSEDKTEVEKFKVKAHGKSKRKMQDKADNLRKNGWRVRVVKDQATGEWVAYARK